MSARARLTALAAVSPAARIPSYAPADHGVGIVHLGLGAFHKAHQAAYTDAALARSGGDWRILGASLRSYDVADALNAQNGLYTLIERGAGGAQARVIGSIAGAIAASLDRQPLLNAMAAPQTRIISLTVTEKAYGILRGEASVDPSHPAIAHDLHAPETPMGVLGYLTRALAIRRAKSLGPLTVLCCDNLPDNGRLLAAGVLDFAGRVDPSLRDWVAQNISFPSTMVDRITPASTDQTARDAASLTGLDDRAAVETEPFTQWVIEDRFVAGRPDWEAGGAIFTDHVAPFENMKLRMLNGAHSMMAYAGFLSGKTYIRDVMASPALAALVARHLDAAAGTLAGIAGMDYADYARTLITRFANPSIAHQTYQIAMDGSQKMPQRIFAPALDALKRGQDLNAFSFATAAWIRYCLGRAEDGAAYDLRDPLAEKIASKLSASQSSATELVGAMASLTDVIPPRLSSAAPFRTQVEDKLQSMLTVGVSAAIAAEAETSGG